MSDITPPGQDEFEISLFGPGVGECVVLHLGWGDWVVVDSCRDPTTGIPVAVGYLRQIGIEPVTAIRTVIATHWHDDHVGGMGELLHTVPDARFVCSAALKSDEFLYFLRTGRSVMAESSGRDEFGKVFDWLAERKAKGQSPGPDAWAASDMRIDTFNSGRAVTATIDALSPSSDSQTRFLREVAANLPTESEPKRCSLSNSANGASVVLAVRVGELAVLLGADLEERDGRTTEGWSAVLSTEFAPRGDAFVFKIPHHGSASGEHERIWSNLLAEEPYALVSPYTRSRLPRGTDLQRLCSHTGRVYCTANSSGRRPPRRDSMVEKTIRMVGVRSRRALPRAAGLVRVRCRIGEDPTTASEVSLFRGAFGACDGPQNV